MPRAPGVPAPLCFCATPPYHVGRALFAHHCALPLVMMAERGGESDPLVPGVCPVGWCSQLPLLALRSPGTRVTGAGLILGPFFPHEALGTYRVGRLPGLPALLGWGTRSCLGLEMHSDVTKWSIILI